MIPEKDDLAWLAATRAVEKDIRSRLGHVCNHLSADQFEQLVRDVLAIKLKYLFRERSLSGLSSGPPPNWPTAATDGRSPPR